MYVGHMRPTSGTTIVDVADPSHPKMLARIDVPEGWHSHKVRVADGIMVVNHEKFGKAARGEIGGGLGIYDVSQAERAEADHRMADHRRRRASLRFRRTLRLHLADGRRLCRQHHDDPRPRGAGEAGRGRTLVDPGPVGAGGEAYPWAEWVSPRCHHPLRYGDRLYVSYWHHGLYILDISDLSKPKPIAHSTPAPRSRIRPTRACAFRRSCKRPRHYGRGRRGRGQALAAAPSFTWVYDITNERLPVSISTFQVPGLDIDGSPQPPMTGCHQPSERFSGTVIPFAWFAQGLRLVDFADPFQPKEVGHYLPEPARRGSCILQRRDHRFARPDLPCRPHPRRRHHRDQCIQ